MDYNSPQAEKMIEHQKAKQRRSRILAALSVLLFFVLVPVLGTDAISMTRKETVLVCQVDGVTAHTHNEDCYDRDGYLICPLPEIEAHTHTDDCYEWEKTLTCSIPESESHTHTDACYTSVRGKLICGKEEVTAVHVHGPDCFRTVKESRKQPD